MTRLSCLIPYEMGVGRCLTEEWRQVPSFPDYIVSDMGRIRHKRVNAPILKGSFDKDGYHQVCLNARTVRVHSAVCQAFHGPRPNGLQAAHLDGNNRNNRADNLAWVTPRENNAHKALHGTYPSGERHPRARLAAKQVEAIRAAVGVSTRKLAAEYGVNQSHIVRIRTGSSWASTVAHSPIACVSLAWFCILYFAAQMLRMAF
jgi:hypothetical protein